jgi:hypothetical protein
MTDRIAGKRGLRESHEPRLMLSLFRTAGDPGYQERDGTHGITENGLDGNDKYSDCGAAAVDHGNAAKADDVSIVGTLGYPVFATTLGTYFAYGTAMGEPGTMPDEGVDNASWLAFLYKNGIIDGYGEVPLTELDAYAEDFNGLLVGVALDDNAETDFSQNIPWDTNAANPPDPNLGHDTWLIITHADGSIAVYTWGGLQAATLNFRLQNISDAWAILDEDDAKRAGVDWASLQAALQSIHGTVVVPPPPPVDQYKTDYRALRADVAKKVVQITAWLAANPLSNARVYCQSIAKDLTGFLSGLPSGPVSPVEPPEPSPVVTPPPTPPNAPEPDPSPSAGILEQVIGDIEKAFDDILGKLKERI